MIEITYTVRCDEENCTESYSERTASARWQELPEPGQGEGWEVVDGDDFCPLHSRNAVIMEAAKEISELREQLETLRAQVERMKREV